jgi:hypothetical protein
MRLFKIISLAFLISCQPNNSKTSKLENRKVNIVSAAINHDTLPNGKRHLNNTDSSLHYYYKEVVGIDTLAGGYITCYGIDDSMKYFYLRRGDSLRLLNKTPIYTSAWSLGTLEKDFASYFVTTIDNGNGVPQTYQVFEKKTGRNLLGEGITAWDYQSLAGNIYFLYDNHHVELIGNQINRKEADSIFLANLNTGKVEGFKRPGRVLNSVIYYEIKRLTQKNLIIGVFEHYTGKEQSVTFRR